MNEALSAEVELLTNLGWRLDTQTDTTASLSTRGPFSWWIFLFMFLLFLGIGAFIYVMWWLIFSNLHVFLRAQNGNVTASGDAWYLERQKVDVQRAIQMQRDIKEKGFWTVAGPSILGFIVVVGLWFFFIWLFIQIAK